MDDPNQFNRLLDEYLDALVLYAGLWNRATAEDVVQEAFLKLLQEPEIPDNPRYWLFRVVRNKMIDQLRHDSMRQRKLAEIRQNRWFEPPPNEPLITADELQNALQQLSKEQREYVTAKIWGGLTFEEIAGLTGSSRSRVHRIYQNALQLLRKILKDKF
ncbi:MAG: sigma-70 family RNA polymerase sigma factor [Planctomycetaceae bacterium]|nr:sigma-70 family RNA polymerase sigma factor [Planctomycetaceae bacterium]